MEEPRVILNSSGVKIWVSKHADEKDANNHPIWVWESRLYVIRNKNISRFRFLAESFLNEDCGVGYSTQNWSSADDGWSCHHLRIEVSFRSVLAGQQLSIHYYCCCMEDAVQRRSVLMMLMIMMMMMMPMTIMLTIMVLMIMTMMMMPMIKDKACTSATEMSMRDILSWLHTFEAFGKACDDIGRVCGSILYHTLPAWGGGGSSWRFFSNKVLHSIS